jgi:hypothetical protein
MRRAGPLYLSLLVGFFALGLLLVLSGFGLDRADRWIDAHAGLLDSIGSWSFRIVFGVIVALCAGTVVAGLWGKVVSPRRDIGDAADFTAERAAQDERADAEAERPIGWGAILVAAIVGYFAWFGVVG